jgi:hypothetical protein
MRMARKFSGTCALGLFGLVAACSDPVAPAAQASVSLYLTTFANAMAGMACPASPHWINVPDAAGGQQAYSYKKGGVAIDGTDQASVKCTVKDTGGPFSVSADLTTPATDPSTGKPINPTLVTLSTTITPDGSSQGTVTIQDARTATLYSSADDAGQAAATCNFSVHPGSMSDQLAVAPGRIWATVTCPRFRDTQSSNANEICSIGSGVVILENCQQ